MSLLDQVQATAAAPEIFLVVAAMALLMFGVFREKSADIINIAAIVVLGLAVVMVITGGGARQEAFGGSLVIDTFARLMKVLTLFGSAVAIVLSVNFMKTEKIERFEYPILVLLATAGMMIMISANDLVALYMGLELQSLALYVVAAIDRDRAKSSEAGLKYFVLGALSSGMLLYGASLIYGFTGSVSFPGIAAAVTGEPGLGLIFGLVFLIAGLAFKVSAVPFHMWTPDVYEGAPTPVAAFFAAAPKIAAMALFIRAMLAPFPAILPDWQQILVFISIASMVLGAFAAIGQTNIKRLLAYSSIGHMGYALIGLAAGSPEGVQSVIIYMAIYLIMTLGSFACVLAMRRKDGQIETIGDLAGLARTNGLHAFFLAVFMFSLAGIPPLAGFFAKYFIFMAAIKANLVTLAIIGVLASVVGAVYYIRIVKLMYFDEPAQAFEPMVTEVKAVIVLAGLFVLLFALFPQPLSSLAQAAAASLF
ncbi:NADH-quinone oxidoreductase subunit NuoN [Phyllobacteriaceae bacterium SYSU D60010]|uniref:NADH-quinone oxidoreductase subunit NuoN n=1 Tax=Taklimakanibacter deserti TaxID=2267839 RepID=UPI000E64AB46